MQRYVIIGTGAIGGTIGGRLAQHGVPVVWVARGEHGRVLRERGMTLRVPDGAHQVTAPVWSGPDEAELTCDDVLVLAVKTNQAEAALRDWADVPVRLPDGAWGAASAHLPILVATNGTHAEDVALRMFSRVFGVCVWCPARHLTPGEIIAGFAPVSAVLHTGRHPAALAGDADARLLEAIRADFESALLSMPLPVDVMAWKRRKLLTNLANVVDALAEPGPVVASVLADADAEARAVLEAAALPVTSDEEERAERRRGPRSVAVPGDEVGQVSSTYQSLARGGELETDYLNGEIVRLAHTLGLQAPVNAALASLGRRAARAGWPPRAMSAGDLRAAVDAWPALPPAMVSRPATGTGGPPGVGLDESVRSGVRD